MNRVGDALADAELCAALNEKAISAEELAVVRGRARQVLHTWRDHFEGLVAGLQVGGVLEREMHAGVRQRTCRWWRFGGCYFLGMPYDFVVVTLFAVDHGAMLFDRGARADAGTTGHGQVHDVS